MEVLTVYKVPRNDLTDQTNAGADCTKKLKSKTNLIAIVVIVDVRFFVC